MIASCKMSINQRDFLKVSGFALGAGTFPPLASAYSKSKPLPRNIIFLVTDGMSHGVVSLAEYFSKIARGRGTRWWSWLEDPSTHQAMMETRSLNSAVTDSAAAASAWGAGTRIFNRAINTLPDGTTLVPIGKLAMAAGKKLGLVTTARITHATPAGFLAAVPHRNMENEIAVQYLESGIDLLLGGGRYHFDADTREDSRDLIQGFRQKNYTFLESKDQLGKIGDAVKIIGLFDYDHLPYTIDHSSDQSLREKIPTLAEMTKAALDHLDRGDRGFFVQIEAARVDHAAHCNDIGALLWDQLAFDDAVAAAEEFASNRDDTLLVLCTDHGNSNPGLNGIGAEYEQSSRYLETILDYNRSLSSLQADLRWDMARGNMPSVKTLQNSFMLHFQVKAEKTYAEKMLAGLNKQIPDDTSDQQKNFFGIAGQILGNFNGVGWSGVTHTADICPLMARGPGIDAWRGFLKNSDVFHLLCASMGLRHQNPSMDYAAAKKFMTPLEPIKHGNWMDS